MPPILPISRVLIITDGCSACNTDFLDSILEKLKKDSYTFTIVGVDFDDDYEVEKDEGENADGEAGEDGGMNE